MVAYVSYQLAYLSWIDYWYLFLCPLFVGVCSFLPSLFLGECPPLSFLGGVLLSLLSLRVVGRIEYEKKNICFCTKKVLFFLLWLVRLSDTARSFQS